MKKLKLFHKNVFESLYEESAESGRKRMHYNLHETHHDEIQVLLNCIQPKSYIPPHRHTLDERDEYLMAIKGRFAFFEYSENGKIKNCILIEPTNQVEGNVWALRVPSTTWHSLISLENDSVLLELKPGPYKDIKAKELSNWAPKETSPEALAFVENLEAYVLTNVDLGSKREKCNDL